MDWNDWTNAYRSGDADYYIYGGPIDKSGYHKICSAIEGRGESRKRRAILVLCTSGGDPHAGYRIARAFIHHYEAHNFRVAVPAECKSAGTLICIGASSLIMFDKGELGPLDIQFQKTDELFQQTSGLDILRGMTYLESDALNAFNKFLLDINGGSGLGTRVASEIASNLVKGVFEPIFAQIDPIRLGEMNAALQIAHEYGSRLNEKSKNLKEKSLSKLIHNYPAHGFVIDRAESRDLFNRVDPPDDMTKQAARFTLDVAWKNGRQSFSYVLDLGTFFEGFFPPPEPNHANANPGNAAAEEPAPTEQQSGATPTDAPAT